jgi:hypothetical protein
MQLVKPSELDEMLRYPRGKCARLARASQLPHVKLPDGQIRFDPEEVERFLRGGAGPVKEAAGAEASQA